MTKDQVILTYSSAVEIYWINWMLRINVHFIASAATSTVPEGFYQISLARERYYDIMADHIEEKKVGTIDKDELRKAISHVKFEDEEEHERNIQNMIQEDDYN